MKYELECRKCKQIEVLNYYNNNKEQFYTSMAHMKTHNTDSYCINCNQNTVKELVAFSSSEK